MGEPLTKEEVEDLAKDWYLKLLDTHAPAEQLIERTAGEETEFRFPEATLKGVDAFRDWYDRIVTTFFDEVHDIKELEVNLRGDEADVRVLVNWQAKVWIPPQPKSIWIGFDAGQTWLVRRSPETGKAVLVTYTVDSFDAMPGSGNLPVLTREIIGKYYEYVNAGDWESWLTLMDDNVEVDEQLFGHLEGEATLAGGVDGLRKGYSKFLMHPQHIVVQGEGAGVVWHCEAANAAGEPIDAIGANYFEVKDGKVTYMRTIHDKAAFAPFVNQVLT